MPNSVAVVSPGALALMPVLGWRCSVLQRLGCGDGGSLSKLHCGTIVGLAGFATLGPDTTAFEAVTNFDTLALHH